MSQKSAIKFFIAILLSQFAYNIDAQTVIGQDSIKTVKDSVTVDSLNILPKNESDIKSPITYSAKDSMMFKLKTKMVYAYGDGKLAMDEMKLEAGYIIMNMDSNYIYAESILDKDGNKAGKPVFVQGNEKYELENIKYNTKTHKGLVKDVITEQGGGFLHGGRTKMMPNKEINIIDGKFTTCDADHPHFYIQLTKAKVIPEKEIISGPFYFVISDIPIPIIGFPFGFFPNQQNRTSGIILPSYGEEERRGFFLQQGGYYWAASDNMDFVVQGDIFTSGSWSLNLRSNYKKRYRYSGNFDISYQKVVQGEKDIPEDRSELTNFWVKLNYARDSKANPTSTFNTNLNFGSSKHRTYNSNDPKDFADNNASSSIAYTKRFPGTPFNFSANISANQNLSTRLVNLTLPTFALNMNKQFPFKRKTASGSKRWYEQVSVGFSTSAKNTISIADSLLFTEQAVKKFQNGLEYKVPVSTSIKILKYFNLSPGFNYNGRIYTNSLKQRPLYGRNTNGIDTVIGDFNDTIRGLNHVYDFSFSAPLSTKLYGIKNFKRGKIAAIRHVMSPSVSFNYRPDFGQEFWGFYETDILDPNQRFSTYQNGIYGSPSEGKSGSLGFSLGNNLEMKTHSKDTTEEFKKIVLLQNLSLTTSYNLAADSFQWSNLNISANTKLFKQVNVTYSSTVDLYKTDWTTGKRINKLYLADDKVLGHLNNATVSLSGSISSDTFKKKEEKKGTEKGNTGATGTNQEDKSGLVKNKTATTKKDDKTTTDDYNFALPWNLSINYSFSYNNTVYDKIKHKYDPKITQTMNLNGSIKITDKWNINGSASYDFEKKKLVHTSMTISRNLHCWMMGLNFVPFGTYKSYSFKINVVSSMFQGLEYKKQESFRDNFVF